MIAILDKWDELVAVLENDGSAACPYWDDLVHEKLNNAYMTLEFKMPGDHEDSKHAVHGNKAVIIDRDGDMQIFEIKTVEDLQSESGVHTKEIFAEHLALELNGRIIRPGTFSGYTAVQYLNMILSGTRWKVGVVEWFGFADIVLEEHKSGIQAIMLGASTFEGEFKFRLEMEHGKLKNLFVDLLIRRGTDTGVQVLYGHNQKSLKRFEDSSEIYTALIGVASNPEGGLLTFEEVAAADKPVGQDWIGDEEALQKYGILMSNGERQHYMGVYTYGGTNEDITPAQLLTYTRAQLSKVSKPKFTYEAGVLDLEFVNADGEAVSEYSHEKMRMGDGIAINNMDFEPEILLSARIIEYKWSQTDKTQNSVVLGDYRDIWDRDVISQIQSLRNTIISNAGKWEQGGTEVIRSTIAPTDTSVVWVDVSSVPNIIKTFNDSTGLWEKATPEGVKDVGGLTQEEIEAVAQDTTEAYSEPLWHVGPAAPTDTTIKWLDTSVEPYITKVYDSASAQWIKATPTEASEVGADPEGAASTAEENAKAASDPKGSAATAEKNAKDYAEPEMHVSNVAPTDLTKKWLDTSTDPAVLKTYLNNTWVKATPTSAGEVGADVAGAAATAEKNAKAASDPKGSAAAAESAAIDYAEPEMHISNVAPTDTSRRWLDISTDPAILKTFVNNAWVKASPTEAGEIGAEVNIFKSTVAPAHVNGRLWLDTSKTPNVLNRSNGSAWVRATPTSAADVGADVAGAAATAESNAKSYAEPEMHVGNTPPADLTKKWVDNSTTPHVMKYYNTATGQWVAAAPTKASEIKAEAVIEVSNVAPTDTTRKWIDISKAPFILKTYQNGVWKAASPTDMSELTGKVAGTQISDNAISTGHISTVGLDAKVLKTGVLDADLVQIISAAGGVVIDENGIFIRNGLISIEGGLADTDIASSSKWNTQGTYFDGNGLYTGRIVAEQLEARVRTIVDNPTLNESLDGWSLVTAEGTIDLPTSSNKGGKALRLTTSGNAEVRSDKFPVDPNKVYRISWSTYSSALGDDAHRVYMGMDTYNNLGEETPRDIIDSITKEVLSSQGLNTYFVYEQFSGWKDYETYLVPSWFVDNMIPAGRGANIIRMSPDTVEADLRFLNFYNNGISTEAWLYSPTISETSSGNFSFNQGYGGTLTLGGPNNGNGRLVVLDGEGNQIADLDAGMGGFQRLYVADFEAPNVAAYGGPEESINFYVAGEANSAQGVATPDDNNAGTAWSMPLATVNEALRRIPKHWDGVANISIAYGHTLYEEIEVRGFAGGGSININGQTKATKVVGRIYVIANTPNIKFENLTLNSTNSYSAVSIWFTDAYVLNCVINGLANYGTAYGVDVLHGSFVQISSNTEIYQMTNAICGRYGGTAFVSGCKGYAKSNGLYTYGGYIVGGGTAPGGASNQTSQYGGSIAGNFTADSGSYVAPPPPETTKTVTSTTGDNWSASYNSWQGSSDGVKQGNWGYGRRTGLWFFGAGVINTIGTGKTIKRMRLKITRSNNSGNSGSVNHYVVAHGYQSRPSGAPSVSGTVGNINLSWGQTGWVTINSSVYSGFASGSYRGFGIYVASDSSSYYSRCELSATIEITYA